MSNIIDDVKSKFVLVIRLGSSEDEPIYWYAESYDKKIVKYGKINRPADLGEIAFYANGICTVLLPANEIIFRNIKINSIKMMRSLKSVSFSIEQSIFGDIDDFHIVILKRDKVSCHIAAIEHELMGRWLHWLKNAGIPVCKMIPDVLTLPFFNGEWSAIKIDDNWLVRNNEMSGFLVNSGFLEKIVMIESPTITINTFSPPDIKNINWISTNYSEPLLVMTKNLADNNINLLTGKYRFSEKITIDNSVFFKIASWFLFLFLVMFLESWYHGNQIVNNIDTLREVSQKFYDDFLPKKYGKNDVNTNFNNYISDIENENNRLDFIHLLNEITNHIDEMYLDVSSLHFSHEENKISIVIEGDDEMVQAFLRKKGKTFNDHVVVIRDGENKYNFTLKFKL